MTIQPMIGAAKPGMGNQSSAALRSKSWLAGDDEVAVLHRVALASAGLQVSPQADRPVIGIANSASDLNPCNLPLRDLVEPVREGVEAAGGVGAEFPTISLGEDLMKPSAMLYRNLLAIEIEEMVRSNPLDGLVILANCDKSVPGALMGAISANIPTVLVTGGARTPVSFRGAPVGTGTGLWRLWDERRANRLDDAGWRELERCLSCGTGACNTMGTASTMAVLSEVLGLMVSGSSSIPAGDPRSAAAARRAGQLAVQAVRQDSRPQSVLTRASFANAIVALHAIGGSSNAVIHLAAMAGRAGVPFQLDDIARLGANVGLLVDVEPSGSGLMRDFDADGGVPSLLRELSGRLDLGAVNVAGQSIGQIAAAARQASGVIRPARSPLREGGAFAVVRGSLAPDGAIVKTSAASAELLRHRGPAVVFGGYADMMRVTDARMSGTSFGTVVLHVAPEAAVGGPLALVEDGDMISLDVPAGTIGLEVGQAEIARRRAAWTPPRPAHLRGWPALYARHVMQAPDGCDLDFLRAPTATLRQFIEPVIGRS
jgi:dihydroxyacid dehydratase/phosphogluconate dehydratase